MTESWALKAVEDAAMKRAFELFKDPHYLEGYLMVMGVNFKQVRKLIDHYENTTGKRASDIE